jgi:predicted regulator of Ras-like GTPase activity (Roadblock/LC7/MglB family)
MHDMRKIESEEVRVKGADLGDKVKELLHEGNVRRIIVKNGEGQTVMEIPVTAGVVVAVIAPIVTALGAIAALAAEWSIEVQRTSEEAKS